MSDRITIDGIEYEERPHPILGRCYMALATEPSKVDSLDIKKMVDRFLGWPFPDDFSPDGGISYKPFIMTTGQIIKPIGTNLLSAAQATEMIKYLLSY